MMRQATVLAALLAAAANAQKFGAKANCTKLADVKPVPDPFTMFTPGKADFHCDMGVPIPFGPVPPGCAKLEVIVGQFLGNLLRFIIDPVQLSISPRRFNLLCG
jgi:hypothetical protein